jgi:hypothetical protein
LSRRSHIEGVLSRRLVHDGRAVHRHRIEEVGLLPHLLEVEGVGVDRVSDVNRELGADVADEQRLHIDGGGNEVVDVEDGRLNSGSSSGVQVDNRGDGLLLTTLAVSLDGS